MPLTRRLLTWHGMTCGLNGKRNVVIILSETGQQADCICTRLAVRLGYTEHSLDAHARIASGEQFRAPLLTTPVFLACRGLHGTV